MHPDAPGQPDRFDVRVISMRPEVPPAIRRVFPMAQVHAATDLRAASAEVLHDQGVITDDVRESITRGRAYHHELPTCGGVGLWQSVRTALGQGSRPLLLLEEDCVPSPELPLAVQRLLGPRASPGAGADSFDLAVFGPLRTDGLLAAEAPAHRGFGWCDGYFWGLHAVLYTAAGRARARAMLDGPVDLQLDAKFSRLAMYGQPGQERLRVLLQRPGEPDLAWQSWHPSDIQGGSLGALGALGALGRAALLRAWRGGRALGRAALLGAWRGSGALPRARERRCAVSPSPPERGAPVRGGCCVSA